MQALILAGGKGEDLLPVTANIPKPMVLVGNIPFLFYQLNILKKAGIQEVIISLSYLPRTIQETLGDGANYGLVVRYGIEEEPMGTAGAIRNVADLIHDRVLVINGDILTTIDLKCVIQHHLRRCAPATVVCGKAVQPARYGVVCYNRKRVMTEFIEKPKGQDVTGTHCNVGIYIFDKGVVHDIPANEVCSLEKEVFPALVQKGKPVSVYRTMDYWLDIGDPCGYLQANLDILSGAIDIPQFFGLFRKCPTDQFPEVVVDGRSFVDPSCIIKPGVEISNSVIGRNCRIEPGARVLDSVILPGTRIKRNAYLRYCIVGKHCVVGEEVSIARGAVFGDKSVISDYSKF